MSANNEAFVQSLNQLSAVHMSANDEVITFHRRSERC